MIRAAAMLTLVLAACSSPSKGGGDDTGHSVDAGTDGTVDASVPQSDESDIVFDPTILHEISIEVAEGDVASLDGVNERVPCNLTFDGTRVENAGVRNKGQTSLRSSSEKLSFSIKLNQFVPGQRLHGLKKLILSNTVQDPSFANEPLTYLVYERSGLPAPRTAHALVTFNGEVKGIYVIVESTDKQFLERHYGDGMGDGNLYEGPWDFPQNIDDADLKDEVEEMRTRDDLIALTAVVLDSTNFASDVAPLLDLDQFIRNAAVEVVTCAWDGYVYAAWNYYLYHRPDSDLFVMLPHGANWPYWHADLDPFDLYVYPWGADTAPGRLAERMRQTPALDAAFRAAVADVAAGPFDVAALEARLDQIVAIVHTAPSDAPAVAADLASFDDGIAEIRSFVIERKAFLANLLP